MARVEDILEPDLAICDPHHHLWDFGEPRPYADGRYLIEELTADTQSGHRIESTVLIDCGAFYRADGPETMAAIGETEFANGVAAMAASGRYGPVRACAGIVSYADLRLGAAVEAVLAAHVAAGNGRFRGIRNGAASDPAIPQNRAGRPGDLYRQAAFREGFAKLVEMDLTFEAWVFHPQLEMIAELADAFPAARIVVNHAGGMLCVGPYASKREEVFAHWSRGVQELGKRENLYMKLGGLGMAQRGFGFETRAELPGSEELAAAWRPYIETCIEAFGVRRAMFESNFPVDGVSCTYANLWNAFKRIAAGASASEKAFLFRDAAYAFYRLAA